ncbi:MAG: chalcone isomerase family protein [Pseudomonadota bacterium]
MLFTTPCAGLPAPYKAKSRLLCRVVAGALAACLGMAAPAAPLEIAGVAVEPSVTVAGIPLVLNGAGVRYKSFAKVNVTEIHASKKFASLDELVALPGPKRVTLTMLREVPSGMMGKSLTRGIEDNYPKSEVSKLVPSLIRISEVFNAHKVLSAGDKVLVEWIPGTGTVVTVRGKVQGEPFREPEFFKAMLSIWLGPVPVDFKLKDALLGQP